MKSRRSAHGLEREGDEADESEIEDGDAIDIEPLDEEFDEAPSDAELLDGVDPPFPSDDGETLAEEAIEELAAVEEADADGIERMRAVLDAERSQTRAALERYRDAVLAAEPALPVELVRGETLDELEASIASARKMVAGVRERLASSERGFPAGAPPRGPRSTSSLTPAEKIRAGLER